MNSSYLVLLLSYVTGSDVSLFFFFLFFFYEKGQGLTSKYEFFFRKNYEKSINLSPQNTRGLEIRNFGQSTFVRCYPNILRIDRNF